VSAATKPAARAPHEIELAQLTKNAEGFAWREFLLRLPEGVVVADLIENPTVWRRVQGDARYALRKLDRLTIVTYAEDVAAECIVAGASDSGVTLGKPRFTELSTRATEVLAEDADNRVAWIGLGYCVLRKKDGQRLSHITPSRQQAERDLAGLRPRPAP
jgi:hypothetical protein